MRTYPDPFLRRWSRRTLTYTMVAVSFVVMIATLPIWLPIALIVDAFRRVHLSTTRAICFVLLYLYWQVWGLVGMFFIWLFHSRNPAVYMQKMFTIEFNWGWNLGNAGIRLFGIHVHIEDDYTFGERPAIVLCRHASITDTFIPLMYICKRFDLPMKYVMKRELEWDPCLDLAVNRMPHLFVVRGSNDATKEIEAIAQMMDNAQPNEGVIIFPEGTRYTPAKRERILKKLREAGQTDILEWAERYQHVLPPRTGGPIALLDHAGKADIVFCAHTGLEHSSSFIDAFNGSLVGTHAYIKFWGAHTEDIPADEEGRKQWLFEQWKKVDDYIEAHQPKQRKSYSAPEYSKLIRECFVTYRNLRFAERIDCFEERPDGGAVVFRKEKASLNVLIPPHATPVEKEGIVEAIPPAGRHKHFGSMQSSQALAQSVFGAIKTYQCLPLLSHVRAEDGLFAFGDDMSALAIELEKEVEWLGEKKGRQTSVDVWLEGDYRVAIECKFAETEFGRCSRLGKKHDDPNHCDGSYSKQHGRSTRCALTEVGVRYWDYMETLFGWNPNDDIASCALGKNYQLVRNILAACVGNDGSFHAGNGHALVIYDARNPAMATSGDGGMQWQDVVQSLPKEQSKVLRRISWQSFIAQWPEDPILNWLKQEINLKYGI